MQGLIKATGEAESLDLQAARDALPEEQRTTLILVTLEDMSYEEATVATGGP